MSMRSQAQCAGLGAALAVLLLAAHAGAVPSVTFQVTHLGGGLYQYDLTLDNTGGAEPLSGLNVLDGFTLFGLDEDSAIAAPAGWSFFAPLPPHVDELNYFSLDEADDVTVDDSLDGFSFETTTAPWTIGWTFEVEAIGGTTSSQIPLGGATYVPEPATALLVALGLALQAARRRRHLDAIAHRHGSISSATAR